MWVIESLVEFHIDTDRCIIIPFPFGTGNDFSNALGWGVDVPSDLIGNNFDVIRQYMAKWKKAKETFFDIWDITVWTNEDGFI